MAKCVLCPNNLNNEDDDVYEEVTSWIGGPRKDGAVLRQHTGNFAHGDCIRRKQEGQAPGQEPLF